MSVSKTKQAKAFNQAISTIRSAARRRLARNGVVSAVDVSHVAPNIKGARRGAAVRSAFLALENLEVMTRSTETVVNSSTRHRVAVYTAL